MITNKLKTGPWKLKDLKKVTPNNKKVFSLFCCGGGSTMGYKLAGFDVLGGVEIDPKIAHIYCLNHNPRYFYQMGVEEFNKIPNNKLPQDLFNLDILDGSPPCSSFSMSGSRDKKWGVKSKFREGQADQILDDLFFKFIDTAKKLKPKVIVAENVKGLITGKAKGYVKEIFTEFRSAGYFCQMFLLNASRMGVPQTRERVFFIANKMDKKIYFRFNEPPIKVSTAIVGADENGKTIHPAAFKLWVKCKPGKNFSSVHEKSHYFNFYKISPDLPLSTLASRSAYYHYHWKKPRSLSDGEIKRVQTFPDDYNNNNTNMGYICGMSVPPFMMQRISDQIYRQLLC